MTIGFVGLGHMGWPMALNLARARADLIVWNRTPEKVAALVAAGAQVGVAATAAELFARVSTVVLMLQDGAAIDAVLQRGSPAFAQRVRGKTIVHMGTTSPEYSLGLLDDLAAAGARYVEAPVSGSRLPAEQGQLVGMLAGNVDELAAAEVLLRPMCARLFRCGPVPQALRTKLAVNLFLVALVASLAEATHLAGQSGVDLAVFRAVLDAGPMASRVSTGKLAKMIQHDYEAQASISDVLMNVRLIHDAARAAAIETPVLDDCLRLYARTEQMGLGSHDMAAVLLGLARAMPPRTRDTDQGSTRT